jgi:hypothetical protein
VQQGRTALHVASEKGHADVVRLLLARQEIEVNKGDPAGNTALHIASTFASQENASQENHVEVVRLLLAHPGVDVNKTTTSGGSALMAAALNGNVGIVRLLLAIPGIDVGNAEVGTGKTALLAAIDGGHDAIVRLVVAHSVNEQVLQLAADAADSLPSDLLSKVPGAAVAAQAAALRLPLYAAAALGDTKDERAAGDLLASVSVRVKYYKTHLAAGGAVAPQALARAREALAHASAQSPSDAAAHAVRERAADAELRAATTTAAFLRAQLRQVTVRKILWSRQEELARGADVDNSFAAYLTDLSNLRLAQFQLEQAESACRFALRHNGQPPWSRLRGPTRALTAAIEAVVGARDERLKRALAAAADDAERVERELASGLTSMSIEADTTTVAASPTWSGSTSSAGEASRP